LLDSFVDTAIPESDLTQFDIIDAPLEPSVLLPDTLIPLDPPVSVNAGFFDNSPEFGTENHGPPTVTDGDSFHLGGFFNAAGPGPAGPGGGDGPSLGGNKNLGDGESDGYSLRNSDSKESLPGGTKATERAVGGGLSWLARHQNKDGSWSFDGHSQNCKDASCTCDGKNPSKAAATAFAMLPFLAAGQTHKSKGPYQKTIADGLQFMGRTVKPDGNLQAGVASMYAQGVATIVLCEAYGMTKDPQLRAPAKKAVEYICRAQHPELGGWHYYLPGGTPTAGDLSVVGWQLMALKSAKMSGLEVPPVVLEKAQGFLKSVSKGQAGGLGSYMVDTAPSPAMTSVLLLSKQFLGAKRNDPAMDEGMKYLMKNLPCEGARNSYYFYYATQAMHNVPGPEWDEWNRATRKYLIETQEKEGCAAGSWNPELPTKDTWADEGGRLLITSVNTLNLEVYYRFLPLYQLDKTGEKEAERDSPDDQSN
jgi:Squalene-hopene cyclase C-terminal domain